MSSGDIAAELSATFDLGLPVCVAIADWILKPVDQEGEGTYPSDAACTRHLGEPWPCPKCAALAGEEKP
jgi:hypothetical protein